MIKNYFSQKNNQDQNIITLNNSKNYNSATFYKTFNDNQEKNTEISKISKIENINKESKKVDIKDRPHAILLFEEENKTYDKSPEIVFDKNKCYALSTVVAL